MDDIKSKVIGGAIVLALGGTGFAVSQTDIVNNFAKETGMSQEQAKKYVEDTKNKLDSFGNIGKSGVDEGNGILKEAAGIDCQANQYDWESTQLSCDQGKTYVQSVGNKEVTLGQCFQKLDTDLGDGARAKISECITDIDELSSVIQQPAGTSIFGADYVTETKNTNAYNKSVLKTALESE